MSGMAPSCFAKFGERYQPYFAVVRGCQVNLRNQQKQLISKGWKLMTTHEPLALRMHLPCRCAPGTYHARCEGSVTRSAAFYTHEFALRACREILRGGGKEHWVKDLKGKMVGQNSLGLGMACVCEMVKHHGPQTSCGHCTQSLQLYFLYSTTGHGSLQSMIHSLK